MNTYLILLLFIFVLWLFYSRRKRRHRTSSDGSSGNDYSSTENITNNEQGPASHGESDGGSGGD
jgi:hypothetical protein